MKDKLTQIRNNLYNNLPTGEVNSFYLIKLIKKHLSEMDFETDENGIQKIVANVSGVYEVGTFKAQMFVPPQNFNRSTKAECLIVRPNLINTLLAVVAVFQG